MEKQCSQTGSCAEPERACSSDVRLSKQLRRYVEPTQFQLRLSGFDCVEYDRSFFFSIMSQVTEFNEYRQRMNATILAADNKVIKRFFNLDTNTYAAGAIDVKTKEMLGLACSMVLRCDDCIKYHVGKCFEEKLTDEEIYEVFAIANIIGGSIVIPHFRRAVEYWEILKSEAGNGEREQEQASLAAHKATHGTEPIV